MKYLSVDIETTGLEEDWCQILEIGLVLADTEDFSTPIEDLPTWSCRVYWKRVAGQPFALHLNADLIKDLDRARTDLAFWTERNYLHPGEVWPRLKTWVDLHGPLGEKMSFSGKNYGTFDSRFLWLVPGWDREAFKARVIDPAVLFMERGDRVVPDLKTCIRRAGLTWDPVKHHRAVEDARMVVELNRVGLRRMWDGRS